jgi:hypothetical protein
MEYQMYRCRGEKKYKEPVFYGLGFPVAVNFSPVNGRPPPMSQISYKMVDRPKGTDPAAEEPPQNNRDHHRGQAPQETRIKGVCGQQGAQTHKRVKLYHPVHGPAAELPPFFTEGRDQTKPQKNDHKETLADSSGVYDFHGYSSTSKKGIS